MDDGRSALEMISRIKRIFNDSVDTELQSAEMLAPAIAQAAEGITACMIAEHKILLCGNGGSAALAQYFSTLLLNRFDLERPGLPAVPLCANTAAITAITHDCQFADVFTKQIRALGQPGDMLLCISTNGREPNIIAAAAAAHDRDMPVIALNGADGGDLARRLADYDTEIRVPALAVTRIMEIHMLIIHCLCDLIDHKLLGQEG